MVYSIRHSSRQDSRVPLKLVYLGYGHGMEVSIYPHGTGFFMCYYCMEGKGEFALEGKRIILQPGQFMMLSPDTPFSGKALADGCTVHLLGFTGPCCSDIMRVCGLSEAGLYQVSDEDILPDAMEQLLSLHDKDADQKEYSKAAYGLLMDLSLAIRKLPESSSQAPVNDAIQMVLEYLEAHYQEPIRLDGLADEVHLTKEYLCTLFKKEMGHTILHRLTLIRIGWARLYLEQYPDKKNYEIGQMCGFENPSYFCRKFRQMVGITPESYRRVHSINL